MKMCDASGSCSAFIAASSDSTSRILDSFLTASAVSGFYAQRDLRNIWEGHQVLRVVEDTISRAKCGKQRTLRVERILIQSPRIDDEDSGALNHHILQSTLDIERSISGSVVSRERERRACLKKSDGECFVVSPLAFWKYSTSQLSSDANILDTLGPSEANNVSISGIPVTPQMVLAGRGSYDYEHASKIDYAKFLALTYFFPDSDCLGTSEHMAWLEVVKEAVGKLAVPVAPTREPTLIALKVCSLACIQYSSNLTTSLVRHFTLSRLTLLRNLHIRLSCICGVLHLCRKSYETDGSSTLTYRSDVHSSCGSRRQHYYKSECMRFGWIQSDNGSLVCYIVCSI